MLKKTMIAVIFLSLAHTAFAYGPSSIALSDRSQWPDKLSDADSFDRASLAEILTFTSVFNEKEKLNQPEYMEWLNLKSINMDSIKRWREKTAAVLLKNYQLAANSCKEHDFLCVKSVKSFKELSGIANNFAARIPATHKSWFENSKAFHEAYFYEQSRLAALFPETSSEILKLSEDEIDGSEIKDKHFILTFDDGPSKPGGTTDKLIEILNKEKKTATFFMLGSNLKKRLNKQSKALLSPIYKGMSVASHGMEHKSHSTWPEWKSSLDETDSLLQNTFENSYSPFFRPPYGKRSQEVLTYTKSKGIKTMLWNIDSQDWNSKITADQVSDRVLTLMLLWRHGIILFHDIHDKAFKALPIIFNLTNKSEINWIDGSSLK